MKIWWSSHIKAVIASPESTQKYDDLERIDLLNTYVVVILPVPSYRTLGSHAHYTQTTMVIARSAAMVAVL